MKNLIAFVGFKASGKNTAAIPLLLLDYASFSFADAIKDSLAAIFCWDRQLLEGITHESRVWREEIDQWWADKLDIPQFSPRWAMMHFGTQLMRQQFNQNIWLYNVERRISLAPADKSVVLCDCRFENEIALARKLGALVIRIKRGDDPVWMRSAIQANEGSEFHLQLLNEIGIHESEFRWIGAHVDAIIENDENVPELHKRVLELVDASYPHGIRYY